MAPIAGMLTTTSTEPRSGLLLESLATTVMVLSPTRAGLGLPTTPTCQTPTRCIGVSEGRGPPPWQPAIASVGAMTDTPAHLPAVFLRAPLMASSPSRGRPEARRARGPDRLALRAAWRWTGPLRAGLAGNHEASSERWRSPLGWPRSSLA